MAVAAPTPMCAAGSDLGAAPRSRPRPDETLIRALARPHRWKRILENGTCRSAGEIAEAEQFDRSDANRLLRLTLLAPDIQEAILDGRQGAAVTLARLMEPYPVSWNEQRNTFLGT
ncbi:MAG: hypothetical protein WAS73_11790 [Defluviicoccus sp.]